MKAPRSIEAGRLPREGARFFAFLFSNFVQKFGQLFLIGGLAYIGSQSDVYRFGLFVSLSNIVVPIFSLNIHMAIGRILFDIDSDINRAQYLFTSIIISILSTTFCLSILALVLYFFQLTDALTEGRVANYLILVSTTVCFILNQYFTVLLRLNDKASSFVVFGLISGACAPLFAACAWYFGLPAFLSVVLGYAGSQVIGSLYAFHHSYDLFKGAKLSLKFMGRALRYSVGTVIFAISQWATNYFGRWLSISFLKQNDLATYTLMGQFLIALTMTLTTIYESRRPSILRDFSNNEISSGTAKIDVCFRQSLIFVAGIFMIVLCVFPFRDQILPEMYNLELGSIIASFAQVLCYCYSTRIYWISIGSRRTSAFGLSAAMSAVACVVIMYLLGSLVDVGGLFLISAGSLLLQGFLAQMFMRIKRPVRGWV